MSDERVPWALRLRQSVINTLCDVPMARKQVEQFCEQLARDYLKKKLEEDTDNATNFGELL